MKRLFGTLTLKYCVRKLLWQSVRKFLREEMKFQSKKFRKILQTCDFIALINELFRNAILLTFDQVVVCDGQLREKPENEEELREFLQSYR